MHPSKTFCKETEENFNFSPAFTDYQYLEDDVYSNFIAKPNI